MASQNGLVDGVRNAARRAATYRINEASFDATVWSSICTTIQDELEARLADRVIGFAPSRVDGDITYEWVANPEAQADPNADEWFLVAHVSATYQNPLYVPLVSYFLDSSDGTVDENLTLEASEQMRVENPGLDRSSPSSTIPPC